MPSDDALFTPTEDGRWLPTDYARGPWTPNALHGGPTAALLARAAEPLLEDLQPARMTIDLLRPVPAAPLAVEAAVVRPGRKVRIVGVTITDGSTELARATVLGIRTAAVPVDVAPTAEPTPPGPDEPSAPIGDDYSDYTAFHSHGVEHRFVRGGFGTPGPATDWIRLAVPVVPAETPSPLQRAVAAADFGNGVSGVGEFRDFLYINPDLTVYLHRLPIGEWICLDAVTHMEQHGVAMAESRLHDQQGPIGRSMQSLLVDRPQA